MQPPVVFVFEILHHPFHGQYRTLQYHINELGMSMFDFDLFHQLKNTFFVSRESTNIKTKGPIVGHPHGLPLQTHLQSPHSPSVWKATAHR